MTNIEPEPAPHALETDPGCLILVRGLSGEVFNSPGFGRQYGLLVGDFCDRFPVEETGRFSAITALGSRSIEKPDILRGHRFLKGSWWATSYPSRYPDPPFLLTDDPRYRLVYHGPVLLNPTDETSEMVRAAWNWDESSDLPVAAEDWFGMVRFAEPDTDRGHLWAFAVRDLRLSGRTDYLACLDRDWPDEFGAIAIPGDESPS